MPPTTTSFLFLSNQEEKNNFELPYRIKEIKICNILWFSYHGRRNHDIYTQKSDSYWSL